MSQSAFLVILSSIAILASGDDACQFVGLRLGKTLSECEDRICTNLLLHSDTNGLVAENIALDYLSGHVTVVLCEWAESTRDQMLKSVTSISQGQELDLNSLISKFGDQINPALERLVYAELPADESALHAMRAVDLELLTIKSNEALFTHSVEILRVSQEMAQFWKLANHVLRLAFNTPRTSDNHNERYATWTHFVVDVASVLGSENIKVEHLSQLIHLLGRSRVRHREMAPYEFQFPPYPSLAAMNLHSLLTFAQSIDALGTDDRDMGDLTLFLEVVGDYITSPATDESAAQMMISSKIRAIICPNLESIFELAADEYEVLGNFTRYGLALLDLCKGQLRRGVSHIKLLSFLKDSAPCLSYTDSTILHLLDDLHKPDLAFSGGMDFASISDPFAFMNDLMHIFVETHTPLVRSADEFHNRQAFQAYHMAFGRLVGLFIGHPVGLRTRIPLNPEIGAAIREVDDPTRFGPQGLKLVLEPVFFIRLGIEEAVGPMWRMAVTDARWRLLFRPWSNSNNSPVFGFLHLKFVSRGCASCWLGWCAC